jgi:CheY-like chemotaxis protein
LEKNQKAVLGVRADKDNSSFVNILIIKDEYARSTVVKLGLHNHHCHTVLAHSMRKGFECLAAMPEIQIIISENTMPSFRGLERIVKIKAHPQWKRIPVILILAKPGPEIAQRAIELGCQHVMVKPFKTKRLLDKIDLTLLEKSFKISDNRRVAVRGAIFQQLHHRVAKLAVRAYKHVSKRLKNKHIDSSSKERSQPIKGFLYRKKKRNCTTVAEWLSNELRIIRRVKPHIKARHKIVTLGEWLSDEIRMIHRRAPYQKFSKKKEIKTERPLQTVPLQNAVRTADTPHSHDSLPAKPDLPINIQYMILFQKAPYLFSKGMRKQIKNTISKD